MAAKLRITFSVISGSLPNGKAPCRQILFSLCTICSGGVWWSCQIFPQLRLMSERSYLRMKIIWTLCHNSQILTYVGFLCLVWGGFSLQESIFLPYSFEVALQLWEQSGRVGVVKPGEEMALGRPILFWDSMIRANQNTRETSLIIKQKRIVSSWVCDSHFLSSRSLWRLRWEWS